MIMRLILQFIIFAIFSLPVIAQNKSDWEPVTTQIGDVKFLFPKNPVIFNRADRVTLDGSAQGVSFTVTKYALKGAKEYVERIKFGQTSPIRKDELSRGGFFVKRFDYSTEAGYSVHIYAGAGKTYCSISIYAEKLSDRTLTYFLESLVFGGEPLVPISGRLVPVEEPSVILEKLNTSTAVTTALERKCSDKIHYADAPPGQRPNDNTRYSRRLILLSQPPPQKQLFYKGSRGRVVLRLLFSANGCVGPAFVISGTSSRSDTWDALRAATHIRFLPAEMDGKPVDSYRNVEYVF